jgi:hypothetical protein
MLTVSSKDEAHHWRVRREEGLLQHVVRKFHSQSVYNYMYVAVRPPALTTLAAVSKYRRTVRTAPR